MEHGNAVNFNWMAEGSSDTYNSNNWIFRKITEIKCWNKFLVGFVYLTRYAIELTEVKRMYKVLQISQGQIWDQNPGILTLHTVFPSSSTVDS